MTADTLTTTGRPGARTPGRFRRSLAARRRGELWGFLTPAIVFFVVFFLFPLGYGVFMSTTDFRTGTFITDAPRSWARRTSRRSSPNP